MRASGELPLADALRVLARWLLYAAVLLSLNTPKFELGPVRVTAGDVLAGFAGLCWLASWALVPATPMRLRAALWPAFIMVLGAASVVSSIDARSVAMGIIEQGALWVLPAAMIPNLVSSRERVTQFVVCLSLGSVIAGAANIAVAVGIGLRGGALPQVWGPVQYFQGYFQAIGLVVAVSSFLASIGSGRGRTALLWGLASSINIGALVLTQTRGAWLAAIVGMTILGILWRRSVLVGMISVAIAVILASWGAGWAVGIRDRALSIFTLDAGLFGFESSVGRLALGLTAWRMFEAHPVLGIGLNNFAVGMPHYAPPEMPLGYAMGPDRVLTAVEGPHSTYLSLLSEVGVFGFLALVCWQAGAWRRLLRARRAHRAVDRVADTNTAILLAAVSVVVVYNCFFEMNQTGTLVLVAVLALGYGTPRRADVVPS